MKKLFFMTVISVLTVSGAFSQVAKLELSECHNLVASLKNSYTPYTNISYVLEKEVSEGMWKKVSSKKTNQLSVEFQVKDPGVYSVSVFPWQDKSTFELNTKFRHGDEIVQQENAYMSESLEIFREGTSCFTDVRDEVMRDIKQTDSKFRIDLNPDIDYPVTYQFYNSSGIMMYSGILEGPKTYIGNSHFASGVYFLTIFNGKLTETRKVVKTR